jgi:tRNA pseudouridine38-40 synthase
MLPVPRQRLILWLAYDGGPWQGWQGQPNGLGIQNQLEAAFASIAREPIAAEAASRTDSGVHALAQLVHADLPTTLQPQQWQRALNDQLPPSIRVTAVRAAAPDFHARFSTVGKVYEYLICREQVLPPLDHGRVWHVPGVLDTAVIRQALPSITGRHNFRRLSSRRQDVSQHREDAVVTTRSLDSVSMEETEQRLVLRFAGPGFLYRMVRVLTGTLVHLGKERMSLADLQEMLRHPEGPRSTQCAPACGLYLKEVLCR